MSSLGGRRVYVGGERMIDRSWRAEFLMSGERELRDTLARIAGAVPERVGPALEAEAEIEGRESDERTPFDKGELRKTRVISAWEREEGGVRVRITYGSDTVKYAVAQHEKFYRHDIGQRKFLESVIRESRPHMLSRVGRRIHLF